MFPQCNFCGKGLADWTGNIMVPMKDYFTGEPKVIREVKVVCKACTTHIDGLGEGSEWHNLWELEWIRQHTIRYLGQIISNLLSKDPTVIWDEAAVDTIYQLAVIAHPELAESATDLP